VKDDEENEDEDDEDDAEEAEEEEIHSEKPAKRSKTGEQVPQEEERVKKLLDTLQYAEDPDTRCWKAISSSEKGVHLANPRNGYARICASAFGIKTARLMRLQMQVHGSKVYLCVYVMQIHVWLLYICISVAYIFIDYIDYNIVYTYACT